MRLLSEAKCTSLRMNTHGQQLENRAGDAASGPAAHPPPTGAPGSAAAAAAGRPPPGWPAPRCTATARGRTGRRLRAPPPAPREPPQGAAMRADLGPDHRVGYATPPEPCCCSCSEMAFRSVPCHSVPCLLNEHGGHGSTHAVARTKDARCRHAWSALVRVFPSSLHAPRALPSVMQRCQVRLGASQSLQVRRRAP